MFALKVSLAVLTFALCFQILEGYGNIKIKEAVGTPPHRNHADATIEQAWNKRNATLPKSLCYLSVGGNWTYQPQAMFMIEESEIFELYVLARGDGYYFQQKDLQFDVCMTNNGDIECKFCGEVANPVKGGWTEIKCPTGLVGDAIKAYPKNPFYTVDICEIIIKGEPTNPAEKTSESPLSN